MDTKEALVRLDALEGEAKALREIIERGDKLEYNKNMLYVAILGDEPYLLVGSDSDNYFCWHSFDVHCTEMGWAPNHKTGQAALDHAAHMGKVLAFSDRFAGMKFFYDFYMGGK